MKREHDVSWPFLAGVEADRDGVDEATEVVAEVVMVAVVKLASASVWTTLSAVWKTRCAEETCISRTRYDGHKGSSGGVGTYDAMGSWIGQDQVSTNDGR